MINSCVVDKNLNEGIDDGYSISKINITTTKVNGSGKNVIYDFEEKINNIYLIIVNDNVIEHKKLYSKTEVESLKLKLLISKEKSFYAIGNPTNELIAEIDKISNIEGLKDLKYNILSYLQDNKIAFYKDDIANQNNLIPFYGELLNTSVVEGNNNNITIKLERTVARIDIRFGKTDENSGTYKITKNTKLSISNTTDTGYIVNNYKLNNVENINYNKNYQDIASGGIDDLLLDKVENGRVFSFYVPETIKLNTLLTFTVSNVDCNGVEEDITYTIDKNDLNSIQRNTIYEVDCIFAKDNTPIDFEVNILDWDDVVIDSGLPGNYLFAPRSIIVEGRNMRYETDWIGTFNPYIVSVWKNDELYLPPPEEIEIKDKKFIYPYTIRLKSDKPIDLKAFFVNSSTNNEITLQRTKINLKDTICDSGNKYKIGFHRDYYKANNNHYKILPNSYLLLFGEYDYLTVYKDLFFNLYYNLYYIEEDSNYLNCIMFSEERWEKDGEYFLNINMTVMWSFLANLPTRFMSIDFEAGTIRSSVDISAIYGTYAIIH